MDPIDRSILEWCAHDFHPLKPLREHIPVGTLYRHIRRLIQLGWLRRQQHYYLTSEAGHRQLIEKDKGCPGTALEKVYPPLRKVPTPVHQAMITLILAAVVARRYPHRSDRHPFFVCAGGTLHWKTSLGLFVCHALRIDPTRHVVDCGSETGRSLSFRRDGRGHWVFKRALLDAPFLVLDEFLAADPSLRHPLNLFLSGRRIIPFENQNLTVHPVPLLTLNPKTKPTLEARIGLSAPQIRRGIIVDLDSVPMPDLTTIGEAALIAAQQEAPISLEAPSVNCQTHSRQIIQLVREILLPEAHARVDFEGIINLCTGMTGVLPDPSTAISQVAHSLGIVVETLNWTRRGWIDSVLTFSLAAPSQERNRGDEPNTPSQSFRSTTNPAGATDHQPGKVSLQVPRLTRDIGLPNLNLSDELRSQLVWLGVETGRPLEETLTILVEFFNEWRGKRRATLATLKRILDLAQELEVTDIDRETLEDFLHTKAHIERYGCTFLDIPECVRLLDLLGSLPHPWDWHQAKAAMQCVARVLHYGITIDAVNTFLTKHQCLHQLGFDETTAEGLAKALQNVRASGKRRNRIIGQIIKTAGTQVELNDLMAERQKLQFEIRELESRHHKILHTLEKAQSQVNRLQEDSHHIQQRNQRLEQNYATKSSDLEVLQAFRTFLLGKTEDCNPFLAEIGAIYQWRQLGGNLTDIVGAQWTQSLREKIYKFFQELLMEPHSKLRQQTEGNDPG